MAKLPNQNFVSKKHLARLDKERIQQRYLVTGAIVIAAVVLMVVLYGILDQTVFKTMRPVAKVGSVNVTTGDFQKQVKFDRYRMIEQLGQMTNNPVYLQFFGSYIQQIQAQLESPQAMGQQVIDTQIENILVEQEAKKRGITLSQAEWDEGVQEAFGYFANGTPTASVTPSAFSTETLSPLQMTLLPPTSTPGPTHTPEVQVSPTGPAPTEAATPATTATEAPATETTAVSLTPAVTETVTLTPTAYTTQAYLKTFDDYAAKIKDLGISKDDLRQFIRQQLLREKVYEAITKDTATTADQVWARHILVATEDEAKAVIDHLNKGEKFDDLAKELSTDSSKDQGGDLGWFGKGKMVKEFEDVVFTLEPGQISQPVKSQFGYHIIQLIGHEEARPLSADEISQAKQKAYKDWLDTAKKADDVKTYDTWTAIVPTEPAIPAQLQSVLTQLQQQQQQPELPVIPQP